jgi:hypothetical protein
MTDVRLKILPPWSIYSKKIEALFDGDPQIACNVDWSGTNPSIALACNNSDKVAALQRILPEEIGFGNVKLKVVVYGIPSNRAFTSKVELFDTAFSGNPAYAYSVCPAEEGYQWIATTYVVFKNYVVQFFADNLNDCHGVISCLYQDIADDILTGEATQGVFYNTDIERAGLGMPDGQWP